jgi:Uma2 family endonuclease
MVLPKRQHGAVLSDEEFERLVLAEPDTAWELWDGVLRRKPDMAFRHNDVSDLLAIALGRQLDLQQYRVRIDKGHVQRSSGSYFIPDVYVIPVSLIGRYLDHPDQVETYREPLPLVVEVWSPSTGRYDQGRKLTEYRRRGDHEIWLIHPYDRTLTAWQRQPDGTYIEVRHTGGTVHPIALPNVAIDLDALFE